MKKEIFNTELNYIKDENIRKSTGIILDMLPDYFYNMPASTTGKHHPEFSLGDMGLVRHVKAAVRIAQDLFGDSVFCPFNEEEKDLITMTLILHDGLKKGLNGEEYTAFDHPLVIAKFIEDNFDKLFLTKDQLDSVKRMISSHMGPWNTSYYSDAVLPVPKEKDELFVHLCDYLASRRFLDIKFENNEIIE